MQIDTEIKEPNFQKMTTNDLFGSHLKGAFRNEEWETHVRSTLAASRHTVRYEIPWRFLKRSIHRFEAVKSEMSKSVAISVAFPGARYHRCSLVPRRLAGSTSGAPFLNRHALLHGIFCCPD